MTCRGAISKRLRGGDDCQRISFSTGGIINREPDYKLAVDPIGPNNKVLAEQVAVGDLELERKNKA